MKTTAIALCVFGFVLQMSSAQAQCACSGVGYVQPAYSSHMYAPPMVAPQVHAQPLYPSAQMPAASVAYVNRLSPPVSRGAYTLNYAIHLTDGRILLTDFLPRGYAVSGSEYQVGGRKVAGVLDNSGRVIVRDPQSNQTIATLDRVRSY